MLTIYFCIALSRQGFKTCLCLAKGDISSFNYLFSFLNLFQFSVFIMAKCTHKQLNHSEITCYLALNYLIIIAIYLAKKFFLVLQNLMHMHKKHIFNVQKKNMKFTSVA